MFDQQLLKLYEITHFSEQLYNYIKAHCETGKDYTLQISIIQSVQDLLILDINHDSLQEFEE